MSPSRQQKPRVGMRVVYSLYRCKRGEAPNRDVGYGKVTAIIPAGHLGRLCWFGPHPDAERVRQPKKLPRFVVKKDNGHYIVGYVHMFDRNVQGSFVGPITLR